MKATEKEYVDTLVMSGLITGSVATLAISPEVPMRFSFRVIGAVFAIFLYYNTHRWTKATFEDQEEDVRFKNWYVPLYGELGGNK